MHSGAVLTRGELVERLRARRGEIERAVLTRLDAIDDCAGADPLYRQGLREAVETAIGYALELIEQGEEHAPPPPVSLLAQARLAARARVGLDVVLRRYFAGYSLLRSFMLEEALKGGPLGEGEMRSLLAPPAVAFDHLLAAAAEEHARESEVPHPFLEQLYQERIERLLAGELVEVAGVAYDFDAWHVAIVAGPGAEPTVRHLASGHGCRLLCLDRGDQPFWAWLGTRRPIDPDALVGDSAAADGRIALAIGEPAEGLAGWRLSHRQAAAALPVAQRGPQRAVRYSDVALLASILQDDLLATTLHRRYLVPLEGERDGGETLRQTLRAYLAAERNVTSAAAALEINRNTVASRLRTIEERLGRPFASCGLELEAALRLADVSELPQSTAG